MRDVAFSVLIWTVDRLHDAARYLLSVAERLVE